MADFSAILTKTLEKMGETTPELRAQVYEKARATVQRQIDALPSKPPQAAIDRQFAKLDAAIAEVEARFAPPPAPAEPDLTDDLEDFLAGGGASEAVSGPEAVVEPEPQPVAEPESEPEPAPEPEPEPAHAPAEPEPAHAPAETAPERDPLLDFLEEQQARVAGNEDGAPDADQPLSAPAAVSTATAAIGAAAGEVRSSASAVLDDSLDGLMPERDGAGIAPEGRHAAPDGESGGPRWGRLGVFALVAALLGGAAYAGWQYQDRITALFQPAETPAGSGGDVPVRTVETRPAPAPEAAPAPAPAEPAPAAETDTVDATGNADGAEKFTQRLTEDGREVDDGPAGGPPSNGEGSSVAGQTTPGAETPAAEEDAAGTETAEEEPLTPAPDAGNTPVPVGQRAIFYEERTGSASGTALAGATIWSVVQESPGGDLPPEPAIRAQASVPDLGVTMDMTIRRNGDTTLPASHIVEVFFNVPDTFEGSGIADVSRITFKATEQDPGNALIAVPAPIDTNIFLVALTDARTAIDTNLELMRNQAWIDIPMQYVSGRRALITLEKGLPGDNVFREVFEAWEANPLPGQ